MTTGIELGRPDWMAQARCHGQWELFDAERGDRVRALSICRGCPVRQQCNGYAENVDGKVGVWGGVVRGTPRPQQERFRSVPAEDPRIQRVRDLAERGLSLRETAVAMGVNVRTVSKWRQRAGMSEKREVSAETLELARRLLDEGLSYLKAADASGVSVRTLHRHFPEFKQVAS